MPVADPRSAAFFYFSGKMARLAELITSTLPVLWTTAAAMGVSHPAPPATTAAALNSKPKAIFTLTMVNMRRERRTSQGSLAISS